MDAVKRNKLWSPGKSSRVCSKHFVSQSPTDSHPFPSLHMGYNCKQKAETVMRQIKSSHKMESPLQVAVSTLKNAKEKYVTELQIASLIEFTKKEAHLINSVYI